MKVYTWYIPEIYTFPIYDRYIPGIFHIYDTIQIPDAPGPAPPRLRPAHWQAAAAGRGAPGPGVST
jgi:hypothetical protein